MQLNANLEWLYGHLPLDQRFAAAAADGFAGVEMLQPYEQAPAAYAEALRAHGLTAVLHNTPIRPDSPGRLGWAAVPGSQAEFRECFDRARAVAEATGSRRIHVMAGDCRGHEAPACRQALDQNLAWALRHAESDDLVLMLEPLNRADMPGYFYHLPEQVVEVLRRFESPRLRLQFDYYHCVKERLDAPQSTADCAPWIGHVQIAGADENRNEPDLSQHGLLESVTALPGLGYDGWLGCEYQPRTVPAENLSWCQPLRDRGVLA